MYYKGKILISTPDISNDIFSRSVILMIEHNDQGAFGLLLNKKSPEPSKILEKLFQTKISVYNGGPVENDKVFFIVKGAPITELFVKLDANFYLTEDIESVITAIINNQLQLEDVRIFSGYSGWSPGQLEQEIERKSWIVVDVFQLDYTLVEEDLWKKIMQNLGGEFLLWANAPKDVSLN